MSKEGSKGDLAHWVRRYEAVEGRIEAERRAYPHSPGESLDRASSLRDFAQSLSGPPRSSAPSAEDMEVYGTWDRLRAALLGRHA